MGTALDNLCNLNYSKELSMSNTFGKLALSFAITLGFTICVGTSASVAAESTETPSAPTIELNQTSEDSAEDPSIIWKYCDKNGNCIYCNDETGKCGILV